MSPMTAVRGGFRRSPGWLIVAEIRFDLTDEIDDVLGSFDQVVTLGGMVLNRLWNVWEPAAVLLGCRE